MLPLLICGINTSGVLSKQKTEYRRQETESGTVLSFAIYSKPLNLASLNAEDASHPPAYLWIKIKNDIFFHS